MVKDILKLEWHALTLLVAPEGVKPGAEFIIDGEAVFVIRAKDYARLLQTAHGGGDDMIVSCENCGAWMDRDDPAYARIEDVTLCLAAATCRDEDRALCRRDRVSEVVKIIDIEDADRWRTPPPSKD